MWFIAARAMAAMVVTVAATTTAVGGAAGQTAGVAVADTPMPADETNRVDSVDGNSQSDEEAVPPWDRTMPIGAICRSHADCSRNGRCEQTGIGMTLRDHYVLLARTPVEDKWQHWVAVDTVEEGSVAADLGVVAGDYIEHVGAIRDDSAVEAYNRLLKHFEGKTRDSQEPKSHDHKEVIVGIVRPPDPKLESLRYGGALNVSVVLAPGEKLGMKLSSANNNGIKVKKVYNTGAASRAIMLDENDNGNGNVSSAFGDNVVKGSDDLGVEGAILKNDIIRKVNGVELPRNATIKDFVKEVKRVQARDQSVPDANAQMNSVIFEIERPMPAKGTDAFKRLKSLQFSIAVDPANSSKGFSRLGHCKCEGSWDGPTCSQLQLFSTAPIVLTHNSEEKYSETIDRFAKVSKTKQRKTSSGGDIGGDRDGGAASAASQGEVRINSDDSANGRTQQRPETSKSVSKLDLKNLLGDRRATSAFGVFPSCKRIPREGSNDQGEAKVYYSQCVYQSYRAVPDIESVSSNGIGSYAIAFASSLSPYGPFFKLKISPWRVTGDGPPSFARCPSSSKSDGIGGPQSQPTYFAQVSLGRILVSRMASSTLDKDGFEDGSTSVQSLPEFSKAPAVFSRPGMWDAHIKSVSLSCLPRNMVFGEGGVNDPSEQKGLSKHAFVITYSGITDQGASSSKIGVAVSETWDGPYHRLDSPLGEYGETRVEMEVSSEGASGRKEELRGTPGHMDRFARDGVILGDDITNITSLSDPFLYVQSHAHEKQSFHLLFMASVQMDGVFRHENSAFEASPGKEVGEDDTSTLSKSRKKTIRCGNAVFHAHASSLSGPWTVSKSKTNPGASTVGLGNSGCDESYQSAGAALCCMNFRAYDGKGKSVLKPPISLSSSTESSGSATENIHSSQRESVDRDTGRNITYSFGRPRVMFTQDQEGLTEFVSFYALAWINSQTDLESALPRSSHEAHRHIDVKKTVFGAVCAHN